MPEAAKFLKGFNLISGQTFDGYLLQTAESSHEVVKRYQEYAYDIYLTFTKKSPTAKYNDLYNSVLSEISQTHEIKGIRNMYLCTIDVPEDIQSNIDGSITFHLKGHSYRKF